MRILLNGLIQPFQQPESPSDRQLWKAYLQAGFRSQKDQLKGQATVEVVRLCGIVFDYTDALRPGRGSDSNAARSKCVNEIANGARDRGDPPNRRPS